MTTPSGNQAFTSRVAAETSASEAQFQHIYQENERVIFRSVYSWVGNREDAEDLTADIFLKAVSGVDYERPPKMIRRWLFQVARTTLIDHWRARDRLITYSLEALPARYRDVLTCRFLLNLSIRDTACRLKLTETNVKVMQFRALKRATELELDVSDK